MDDEKNRAGAALLMSAIQSDFQRLRKTVDSYAGLPMTKHRQHQLQKRIDYASRDVHRLLEKIASNPSGN